MSEEEDRDCEYAERKTVAHGMDLVARFKWVPDKYHPDEGEWLVVHLLDWPTAGVRMKPVHEFSCGDLTSARADSAMMVRRVADGIDDVVVNHRYGAGG